MYGGDAFAGADYFFWIPLVAPLVGGVVAAFTYLLTISAHHTPDEIPEPKSDYIPVQTDGKKDGGKNLTCRI